MGKPLSKLRLICYHLSMPDAIDVNRKSRGRPRVDAVLVGVRIPPKLLAKIDKFMGKRDITSRPVAIRRILEKQLDGEL